jgi:hypothetical protein
VLTHLREQGVMELMEYRSKVSQDRAVTDAMEKTVVTDVMVPIQLCQVLLGGSVKTELMGKTVLSARSLPLS